MHPAFLCLLDQLCFCLLSRLNRLVANWHNHQSTFLNSLGRYYRLVVILTQSGPHLWWREALDYCIHGVFWNPPFWRKEENWRVLNNLRIADDDNGCLKLLSQILESTMPHGFLCKKGTWKCQRYYTSWLETLYILRS